MVRASRLWKRRLKQSGFLSAQRLTPFILMDLGSRGIKNLHNSRRGGKLMLRGILERFGRLDPSLRRFPMKLRGAELLEASCNIGCMDGFAPAQPFIDRSCDVVTMGSCFATNSAKFLRANGYRARVAGSIDRLFTPPALQFFAENPLRDGKPVQGFIDYWRLDQAEIDALRQSLLSGSPVIITFGLAMVWVNNDTGEIIFDPQVKNEKTKDILLPRNLLSTYEMKLLSLEETTESILATVNALRAMNIRNKIILTLSPIPLVFSCSDYPVVVADCLSKSTLRLAIDSVMRLKLKDIFYFPSYEIIKWVLPMITTPWGAADGLITHVKEEWIDYVMRKFAHHYIVERGHEWKGILDAKPLA
ncbi:MAG: hypothetical protein EXR10_11950 [Alphaproteobacteria bacterium]|nr:hypothetical protein [Alphaproteobacteria bacterium]